MSADLVQLIDREVTIDGVARNAAGGAVVVTGDQTPIYLAGLSRWDPALDGQKVRATGILREVPGQGLVNEEGEVRVRVGGTGCTGHMYRLPPVRTTLV